MRYICFNRYVIIFPAQLNLQLNGYTLKYDLTRDATCIDQVLTGPTERLESHRRQRITWFENRTPTPHTMRLIMSSLR